MYIYIYIYIYKYIYIYIHIYIQTFLNPSHSLIQVQAIFEQIRRKTYKTEVQKTNSNILLKLEKILKTFFFFDLNEHDV